MGKQIKASSFHCSHKDILSSSSTVYFESLNEAIIICVKTITYQNELKNINITNRKININLEIDETTKERFKLHYFRCYMYEGIIIKLKKQKRLNSFSYNVPKFSEHIFLIVQYMLIKFEF